MIEYLVISAVTLIVAILTFFSGFGLGTLLLPVFSIFFPIEIAVASTALVHLLNNFFKLVLAGKYAHIPTIMRFTIPAAIMALPGALLLSLLSGLPSIYAYQWLGKTFIISPIKLVIALLLLGFSLLELIPSRKRIKIDDRYISLGGAISGFFGGVSGHQGVLRSMFLIRAGLDKNAYVGTTVVSAVIVDIVRLFAYSFTFLPREIELIAGQHKAGLIGTACFMALTGSLIGRKLLKKVSIEIIQLLVGVMIITFSLALGLGLV